MRFAAIAIVFAAGAAAAREFTLQPRWIAGGSGSSLGDFGTPESVAIDSLGQVVVTDKGRMMLHVYAADDGTPRRDIGGLGTALGRFDRPNGIVVDAAGNILVVEQRNQRVQIFDREYRSLGAFGARTTASGGFIKPMGIALDGAGRIYVTDEARADVQVFDPNGKFLWRFGLDPRLDKVESIEVHEASNRIFVCDEGRSCVNVYDLEGRYIERFGRQGSGPGEFGNDTNAVRLDDRGRIYVNDQGNMRINVYAADTRFLASFYNAAGGMESADGIALSERHDLLCVADQGNNRVLAFDLSEFGCRLDALELAAPAPRVGSLSVATDPLGPPVADFVWADAPLWFEALAAGGDPQVIESAIVHVRSQRDPAGIRVEMRETSASSNRLRGFVQLGNQSQPAPSQLATFEHDSLRIHLAGDPDRIVPVLGLPAPHIDGLSVDGNPLRQSNADPVIRWRFVDPAALRQQTGMSLRLRRERDQVEVWSSGVIATAETQSTMSGAELQPGEDYRVELRVATGRSWSSPAVLLVRRNLPPPAATAPDPALGAVVASAALTLRASVGEDPDGDPTRLWFEIETNRITRSPVNVRLDAIASWTVPEHEAPENSSLRWRIVHDDGYQKIEGPWWSVTRNRTEEPPLQPVLQAPVNGAVTHEARIELQWRPLVDPDPGPAPTASIEWCRSPAFEAGSETVHTIVPTGATVHVWREPLADGIVYWRVRARDASGMSRTSAAAALELRRSWHCEMRVRSPRGDSEPLVLGVAPGAQDGADAGDRNAVTAIGWGLIAIGPDGVLRHRDHRAPRDPAREPTVWDVRILGSPHESARLELTSLAVPADWEVEIAASGVAAKRLAAGASAGFRCDASGVAAWRVRFVARGDSPPPDLPAEVVNTKPGLMNERATIFVRRGTRLLLGGSAAAPWRAELHDVRGRRIRSMTGSAAIGWVWDGEDERGEPLARGTYFLRVLRRGTWSQQRLLWLAVPAN